MNDGHNRYKEHVPLNCPPEEAEDKDYARVFRLCVSNPPDQSDFLSHIELGKKFPPEKTCLGAGISLHTDRKDSERLKKRIPTYRKKGYIASGRIPSGIGKTLSTPSNGDSHHTCWVYRGKDIYNYFE
ncbi:MULTISPECIES: hypothetical protein [Bacillus]|uniref:Uncharacterized protein n=1 Tax=Bacillus cabrialesii subsp. tritici TaxID=2944916 RepID=A0ABT9DIJ9_9BACI|nr:MULTISPECIES: hypothetical protein [Bacillus]ARV98186.1 hypothetical protein S101444_01338 [Bacillus subtilis subsp. subtilis]ARW02264.1 hypothetical protein S100757_01333 [Bacillus subtilis subsp. subtilis]ASB56669.1 hypothetical protein S100761_01340 [Bacillus subtilis subsp. subtilis]ASB69248.1 hypothetical protein S100333_01355 [Bacillus subtilis subsp. subtilis]ASZ60921.1 hypothetical protein CLD04_06985 [Bacillus subtilis]